MKISQISHLVRRILVAFLHIARLLLGFPTASVCLYEETCTAHYFDHFIQFFLTRNPAILVGNSQVPLESALEILFCALQDTPDNDLMLPYHRILIRLTPAEHYELFTIVINVFKSAFQNGMRASLSPESFSNLKQLLKPTIERFLFWINDNFEAAHPGCYIMVHRDLGALLAEITAVDKLPSLI